MSYIDDLNQAAQEALLASASATISAGKLDDWINGGENETVETDNGPIPTWAGIRKQFLVDAGADLIDVPVTSEGYGDSKTLGEWTEQLTFNSRNDTGSVRKFPRTKKMKEEGFYTSVAGNNLNFSSVRKIPRGITNPVGTPLVFGQSFIEGLDPREDGFEYNKPTYRNIPRAEGLSQGVYLMSGNSIVEVFGDNADEVSSTPFSYPLYTAEVDRLFYAKDVAGESQIFTLEGSSETQLTSAGNNYSAPTPTKSGVVRCVRDVDTTPTAVSILPSGVVLEESEVLIQKMITGQSLALGSRGFILTGDPNDHEITTGVYGRVFTESLPEEFSDKLLTLEGGPRATSPSGSTVFEPMREYASSTDPLLGESISSSWAVGLYAWAKENTGISPRLLASISAFGGQAYDNLKKGTTTYNNALNNVTNVNSICGTEGLQHFVHSISIVHGESQTSTTTQQYVDILAEWVSDYQTDIVAITGQSVSPVAFISQANTGEAGTQPAIPNAQLRAHKENPSITLVCPKYQFPYFDTYHMLAEGYVKTGEIEAKAESFVMQGLGWNPLYPLAFSVDGDTITIDMSNNVAGNASTGSPVGKLVIDTDTVEETDGYGFEVEGKVITSVELGSDGQSVVLTVDSALVTGDVVKYASQDTGFNQPSNGRRGNIRDSDTRTVSRFDGKYVYNWLVAFTQELTV